MSFLTPVYLAGTLKGIVMVDVNRDNLKIFLYRDRPLVWRYLNVTLKDMDSGKEIIINQSKNNLFQYVNYSHDIPGGLRVSLSLDLTYFLVSSRKALAFTYWQRRSCLIWYGCTFGFIVTSHAKILAMP